MWLHVMECPLILLRFSGIFIHYYGPFMSELLYLHQKFTDYISNRYTHSNISTCQMSQQVMECILILFRLLRIVHTIDEYSSLKCCISTKLLRIVFIINTFILIYWYARCSYKLRKFRQFNWFFCSQIICSELHFQSVFRLKHIKTNYL